MLKNTFCNNTDDARLLSREEIMAALELLIRRLDTVAGDCADGFPLYAPGNSGRWAVSAGGSWVGGFWAGLWWLRARLTGAASDRCKAAEICRRLVPKIDADSINRSLIFRYGAALGDLWCGDEEARRLAGTAAAALAASYDPELQCIPLGTDMGGGAEGRRLIAVDAWAALIQLLCDNGHEGIARRHTDTLIAACRAETGAFYPHAHFERGCFRPTGRAGDWSRGQAWAMLGLVRAAARWGEPYSRYADAACEYWRQSRPEPLPRDRLGESPENCDLSAAAIASVAMLSLAELAAADGDRWRTYAHRQLTAIVRSRYFTGFRQDSGGLADGLFWGCRYNTGRGEETSVETAWGSFFLLAALAALAGAVEAGCC
jgi:unsaturated chondroitin disaccharide hydrolase